MDEHIYLSPVELLDSSESNGNRREKVLGFKNALFPEMSGEVN